MQTAELLELRSPSLAVLLQAETSIGQARTPRQIAAAAMELHGRAPDADVILAAWRQSLRLTLEEQREVIERLDDMLA
ncbi:hypothetical protein [Azonexus hydrophilus]|uniref:Uncharacterized protein n=1 Tax=Azonexus hydrophilus TaxID=418702 RepID=A0ABZ2XF21_9RHOO